MGCMDKKKKKNKVDTSDFGFFFCRSNISDSDLLVFHTHHRPSRWIGPSDGSVGLSMTKNFGGCFLILFSFFLLFSFLFSLLVTILLFFLSSSSSSSGIVCHYFLAFEPQPLSQFRKSLRMYVHSTFPPPDT